MIGRNLKGHHKHLQQDVFKTQLLIHKNGKRVSKHSLPAASTKWKAVTEGSQVWAERTKTRNFLWSYQYALRIIYIIIIGSSKMKGKGKTGRKWQQEEGILLLTKTYFYQICKCLHKFKKPKTKKYLLWNCRNCFTVKPKTKKYLLTRDVHKCSIPKLIHCVALCRSDIDWENNIILHVF